MCIYCQYGITLAVITDARHQSPFYSNKHTIPAPDFCPGCGRKFGNLGDMTDNRHLLPEPEEEDNGMKTVKIERVLSSRSQKCRDCGAEIPAREESIKITKVIKSPGVSIRSVGYRCMKCDGKE